MQNDYLELMKLCFNSEHGNIKYGLYYKQGIDQFALDYNMSKSSDFKELIDILNDLMRWEFIDFNDGYLFVTNRGIKAMKECVNVDDIKKSNSIFRSLSGGDFAKFMQWHSGRIDFTKWEIQGHTKWERLPSEKSG